MKKNGFTLIELLVAIVIIALLGGVGVISFTSIFGSGEKKYYETLETNTLLAGNDYFLDHRDELPSENHVSEVSFSTLVNENYVEPLKKSNGEVCTEGKVYVYKENSKYRYESCIECDENYSSNGKYCNGEGINEIVVVATKAISNASYDVSKDYNNTSYSSEDIILNVSMKNATTNVSQFDIINTKTEKKVICTKIGNSTCETENGISSSGTYKIIAKQGNKVIATKYINVKIDKGSPKFSLVKEDITPLTCVGNNTKREVTIKIIKNNINEEYQHVEYKIYQKVLNETTNEDDVELVKTGTEANLTSGANGKEYYIKESLESGSYELLVKVTNFIGEYSTNDQPLEFDVSYYADIEYTSNSYNNLDNKHEVVYGKTYNYKKELLSTVPSTNIEINWTKNNEVINGNTKVVDKCTHTIVGNIKAQNTIQKEEFEKYCVNVTYNGEEQYLTSDPPANVEFKNRKQTDVVHPKLYASIDPTKYVWSDGTVGDYEFDCPMTPLDITITATDQDKIYDGSPLTANNECTYSGNLSDHSVTCSNNTGSIINAGYVGKVVGDVTITHNDKDVTSNYNIIKVNGTLTVNKATPTLYISSTSGEVPINKTTTYTIKANVDGTFANTSNAIGTATVSPATTTADANTDYTITVTGKASSGSTTIDHDFTPSSDNYESVSISYAVTVTKLCYTYGCSCKYKNQTGYKYVYNKKIYTDGLTDSVKQSTCGSQCNATHGNYSNLQGVTMTNIKACENESNGGSTSCFPYDRNMVCEGPYSSSSGHRYYQTVSECRRACGSKPSDYYCSCSCNTRSCQ